MSVRPDSEVAGHDNQLGHIARGVHTWDAQATTVQSQLEMADMGEGVSRSANLFSVAFLFFFFFSLSFFFASF